MAQSTGRDLHIDVLLSNVAIGYMLEDTVAGLIAPVVQVNKQSDAYAIYSRADALRIEDARRSPGTEANKVSRSLSSDTYIAKNYALKYPVTLEDRENADPIQKQNIINDGAQYITDKLKLDWENRVSGQVNSTSNVGSSAAVASEWDAAASSDPLGDMNTALDVIQDRTGKRGNRIVMGVAAWRSLRRNDQILNRLFGSNNGGGYASKEQVASLLEIDQLLVASAYQNTGNEAQAESLSTLWTDNVLAYYAPQSASRDQPSFMYSFRWAAGGLPNMQAERHPFDQKTKSEEVEVGYYQDEKITGSEYSFLLRSVNSST
jgi:hypothetical protein